MRRIYANSQIVGAKPEANHHDLETWLAIEKVIHEMRLAAPGKVDWDTFELRVDLHHDPDSVLNGLRHVQIQVHIDLENYHPQPDVG